MKERARQAPLDHRTPLAYRGLAIGTVASLMIWLVIIKIVQALI